MRYFRKKTSTSSTPINSRPSTPTPPAEYIKKELGTFYPKVKDKRTLAASTSAIALSIVSASGDPSNIAPNEPGSSKESAWKTAYGAAKIAIETIKESSDLCLPLKAVVGALSVLIKNYDQTTTNAEQIEDIERRIQSLSKILASPVSDQDAEEKARRFALGGTLNETVSKLRPLSDRCGLVQFLNNEDYSNTLNGFVQDLANAVTDYQTSIQRTIYENTKEIGDDTKRIDETTRRTDDATKRIEEVTKKTDETSRNLVEAADLDLMGKLGPVYDAGYQAGHHDTCLRGTREPVLDGIMQWARNPQERYVFWLNGLAGTGKSTIAQTFSQAVAQDGTLGASFFCSRDYLDRQELKNIFPTLAYQLACKYPSFRSRIIRIIKQDPSVARNSLISQLEDLIVHPLSSTGISCVIVIDALDECVDDQPSSALLSVLGRYVKQLQSVKFFITGRPEPRIRTGFRLPLLEPLTHIFLLHEVELASVDRDIRLYLQEKLSAAAKRRSDLDLSNPWPSDDDLTALTKKSSGLFIFASTLARFIESEHHEPDKRLRLVVALPDSTIHEGRAGIDPLYVQVLAHAFSGVDDAAVFADLRRVLGAVVLGFNPLSRAQIAKILDLDGSLIAANLRHLHSVLLIPNEASKAIRIFHKSFPDFLQDPSRCSDSKFFIDPAVHHGEMALGCLELLKKLRRNPCDLPNFTMNHDITNLPELLEDKVESATRYACGYWAMHVRSSPITDDFAIRLVDSATEFLKNNVVPWIEVMGLENQVENVIYSIYHVFDWLSMVNVSTSNLRSLAQDCLRFTMYFFHLIQQSAPHIYHSALSLSPRPSTFRSRIPQDNTLIAEFAGCPDTWGAVIRTITTNSGRFTCMTTFSHRIAAASDDGTVGVYDSVTGALRLSLSPPDPVRTIKGSPDGSMLFCAHQGPSITVWDIQTGGLIHTFVLETQARDIAVSLTGRYLAFGLSSGTVKVWEIASNMEVATFESDSPLTHLEVAALRSGSSLAYSEVATSESDSPLFQSEAVALANGSSLTHWEVTTLGSSSSLTHSEVATFEGDSSLTHSEAATFESDSPLSHLEVAAFESGSPLTYFCWLEPGEQLVIANGASVRIRDVISGEVVRSFTINGSAYGVVFAQRLNKFAILAASEFENTVTIVDSRTGTSFTDATPQRLSCFAFSQITTELVCGTNDSGLQLFNISLREWRQFHHPATTTSVSALSSGFIVANVPGSGIQFLSTDEVHTPPQQLTISVLAVHALDQDDIIAVIPNSRDRTTLLELATMSSLLTIPTQTRATPTRRPPILCASVTHRIAVCCYQHGRQVARLELWRPGDEAPAWICKIGGVPRLVGRISPSGSRLVALDDDGSRTYVWMWDTENGSCKVAKSVGRHWPKHPLEIKFESEDQFYSQHEGCRIPFTISSPSANTYSIAHHEQVPSPKQPQRYYSVDEAREWVVRSSSRICWIPPGYIGSDEHSYCWIGNTLVMAGQDGVLRKLAFREQT